MTTLTFLIEAKYGVRKEQGQAKLRFIGENIAKIKIFNNQIEKFKCSNSKNAYLKL